MNQGPGFGGIPSSGIASAGDTPTTAPNSDSAGITGKDGHGSSRKGGGLSETRSDRLHTRTVNTDSISPSLEAWKEADENNDGYVDDGEIHNYLFKAGIADKDFVWQRFDSNKDGKLSQAEFTDACALLHSLSSKNFIRKLVQRASASGKVQEKLDQNNAENDEKPNEKHSPESIRNSRTGSQVQVVLKTKKSPPTKTYPSCSYPDAAAAGAAVAAAAPIFSTALLVVTKVAAAEAGAEQQLQQQKHLH